MRLAQYVGVKLILFNHFYYLIDNKKDLATAKSSDEKDVRLTHRTKGWHRPQQPMPAVVLVLDSNELRTFP